LIRGAIALLLVAAMLAFGYGVYEAAGLFRAGHRVVHRPTEVSAPSLPGTMYVVQGGGIYRFQHGSFKEIKAQDGWMQPSAAPGGRIVVVRRQPNYSDLFLLDPSGATVAQLTHDAASRVEDNHWAFYPRYSADGQTLFYDFDPKDPYGSYQVDLSIFGAETSNNRTVKWTQANAYTGGDVSPVPLHGGMLLYTKYSIDDSFQVHAQLWIQRRAGSPGLGLTTPVTGCGQAAVSPDEQLVAMVCNKGSNQDAELDVAPFDAANLVLGTPTPLVTGRQVASPAFSPDGKTIAFLAPDSPGGNFQLWTVGIKGPSSIKEITTDLALDSTSAPVWLGT
jgi:Tol biopolymer transport system component